MTFGQKLACHIAPIFLRLVLGLTFLWAGLGKILKDDFQVTEANAPALVRMGAVAESRVEHLLPPGFSVDDPDVEPETGEEDEFFEPDDPADGSEDGPQADGSQDGSGDPPERTEDGDPEPPMLPEGDGDEGSGSAARPSGAPRIILTQTNPAPPSAPDEVKLKRLYGVAVMTANATKAKRNNAGEYRPALLPKFMGDGAMPKYLGWATAITEVFAGGFLLIGFLTRISALAIAAVMAVALWLTTIGPAAMGYKDAIYGFIPAPPEGASVFDPPVYQTAWWQLALLGIGLALLFSGAGALSLDRLLFGGGPDDLEHDD